MTSYTQTRPDNVPGTIPVDDFQASVDDLLKEARLIVTQSSTRTIAPARSASTRFAKNNSQKLASTKRKQHRDSFALALKKVQTLPEKELLCEEVDSSAEEFLSPMENTAILKEVVNLSERVDTKPDSRKSAEDQQTSLPPLSDRRNHPRHSGDCVIQLANAEGKKFVNPQHRTWLLHCSSLRGEMLDISLKGVGFTMAQPLPEGTTLFLRISNLRYGNSLECTAEVKRCIELSSTCWKIGCEFSSQLSYEQVSTFSRQLEAAQMI